MRASLIAHPWHVFVRTIDLLAYGHRLRRIDRSAYNRTTEHASSLLALDNINAKGTTTV